MAIDWKGFQGMGGNMQESAWTKPSPMTERTKREEEGN